MQAPRVVSNHESRWRQREHAMHRGVQMKSGSLRVDGAVPDPNSAVRRARSKHLTRQFEQRGDSLSVAFEPDSFGAGIEVDKDKRSIVEADRRTPVS